MQRRTFLLGSAGAVVSASASLAKSANDTVRLAILGVNGRGGEHIEGFQPLKNVEIAVLCDPDQNVARKRAAEFEQKYGRQVRTESDLRRVFDDRDIDAVSIATPNHWHALATIWACQAGKDVYVEKPACHNVFEGLKMIEAARKYNRIVQIGSQGRSAPHKIKAMQLLRDGVIGKVYMAKGLCFKRRRSIGRKPDGPVPPGVDWDMFLGPAPKRPFNANRYKYNWHWFWDTGNGDIGNQGIHEMDIARWGFGRPGFPQHVVCTGGKYVYDDDQETPNTQTATFDYGDAQIVFEVRGLLTGSEGGLAQNRTSPNVIGDLFYGSDGWMAVDGGGFQVYKGEKGEKVMDEKSARGEESHFQNFLHAVRTRNYKDLTADVEIGVHSAVLVHLANASYRTGRKLAFDSQTMKFRGDAEASQLLTRKYRAPYVVPERV